jgi:hypothetical protein
MKKSDTMDNISMHCFMLFVPLSMPILCCRRQNRAIFILPIGNGANMDLNFFVDPGALRV